MKELKVILMLICLKNLQTVLAITHLKSIILRKTYVTYLKAQPLDLGESVTIRRLLIKDYLNTKTT